WDRAAGAGDGGGRGRGRVPAPVRSAGGAGEGGDRHLMCGIVGYVGARPCKELLLTGLERLEYRGYDSAGICLLNGDVDIVRRVGRVQSLRDAVGPDAHPATTGLAHTRWATHG